MRIASIRSMDISNGEGIGASLFVQGCHSRCPNCFNSETWDFNGGEKWTEETKNKFLELCNKSYIKRVSILGGEPLAGENINDVLNLVNEIHLSFLEKTIWLYTGYTWEEIFSPANSPTFYTDTVRQIENRKKIVSKCDVLVDGRYVHELRDLNLKFRGSRNQRLIDVKQSLLQSKIICL